MAHPTIGEIPAFTDEGNLPIEEVKELPIEVIEKETPELPAEKPTEDEIVGETAPLQSDTQEKAIVALQDERVKLLKEISELRGQRRDIKQEQLQKVETQLDELKDLHPEDVATIERVLRSKGYMTKEEQSTMLYETVKNEELSKFLDKYPEYKPENDPNDINWQSLQKEFALYKMPSNPRLLTEILERAHRALPKAAGKPVAPELKRRVEIASVGGGGTQKSSSTQSLSPERKEMLRNGGFTEDDIKAMEARL